MPGYDREICYGGYTILGEESDDLCIGWKPTPCSVTERVFGYSNEAWNFTSGE